MLAIPEEVRSCAKLLSPADEPIGTPSSRIWCPEAPSSTPLPPLASSACFSSPHVVSNCAEVFAWPNSYSRANFSRMFKLRTNALAPPPCVSGLISLQAPRPLVPHFRFLPTTDYSLPNSGFYPLLPTHYPLLILNAQCLILIPNPQSLPTNPSSVVFISITDFVAPLETFLLAIFREGSCFSSLLCTQRTSLTTVMLPNFAMVTKLDPTLGLRG